MNERDGEKRKERTRNEGEGERQSQKGEKRDMNLGKREGAQLRKVN